ncbi:MAG: hypothetical protein FGM14_09305 [Flavobacteriales bacterium]|nr:hypothetical protein [Flavobacteriales bacterium]
MKFKFLIVAFLICLFSCSKENRVAKKLDGNWTVDFMQVQDGEGFMYFDSIPNGTFNFLSDEKIINANVAYKFLNLNGFTIKDTFKVEQENYIFNSKFDRIYFKIASDSINARIILLTKKSMELEYYDLNKFRLVRFILSKD